MQFRARLFQITSLSLSLGCLPKVDFTPCAQTDRCVVRSDAIVDRIDVANPPDAADAGDAPDATIDTPDVDVVDASAEEPITPLDVLADVRCGADETRCGGTCTTVSSDNRNCGACGNACLVPIGGSAECRASTCIERCPPGTLQRPGRCEAISPPRLLWPSPTARVATRRPQLRWQIPPGAEGVRVEYCLTRDCASPLASEEFLGSTGVPSSDLPAGVVFWRARTVLAPAESETTSATWQLVVPTVAGPAPAASGMSLDFNGDGHRDLAVWNALGFVELRLGASNGPASTPAATLRATRASVASLRLAGDVNGDGFSDLVLSANSTTLLFLGAADPRGELVGIPVNVTGAGLVVDATGVGDLNGDGAGDLVVRNATLATPDTFEWNVLHGARSIPTGWVSARGLGAATGPLPSGAVDFNHDEFAEFLLARRNSAECYLGSSAGVSATPVFSINVFSTLSTSVITAGDVNRDGRSDLIVNSSSIMGGDTVLLYLTPETLPFGRATQTLTTLAPTVVPIGDIDNDGFSDCAALTLDEIRIHRGTSLGYATTPFATLPRATGASVPASAGTDFNRDGFDDFVITTPTSFTVVLGAATAPLMSLPPRASPSDIVAF